MAGIHLCLKDTLIQGLHVAKTLLHPVWAPLALVASLSPTVNRFSILGHRITNIVQLHIQ